MEKTNAKSETTCIGCPETGLTPTQWEHFELKHYRLPQAGEVTETVPGYQVCLILSGRVSVNWKSGGRNVSHDIGPQDLCTASYGDFCSLSWYVVAPCDLLHLNIPPKVMADLSEERGDGKAVELITHRGLRDHNIANLMHILHTESAADSRCRYGPRFGEQLGLALAVYLFEHYCISQPKEQEVTTRLPGRVLKKVLAYIDERIAEPVTIEDLANHVQMSRFYFSRLFRNTVGQSPGQYFLDRRMDRAKALLREEPVNVKDAARLSGFSSESHFTSAFRRRNGFTPSQYRRMLR